MDALSSRLKPFVAKYGTRLNIDVDAFRHLTGVDLLYAISAKLNEVVKFSNDTRVGLLELNEMFVEYKVVLDEIYEKFANGGFIQDYIEQIREWIDANICEIVGKIAKFVQFGLNDDGYFVAYIPANWDFLCFDTVVDPESENYGCLVLRY